jgi:hypothetical protein
VRFHFSQIAVITDVIANAVLIDIPPLHTAIRDCFDHLKCFQNRTGILFSPAEVIDLTNSRILPELEHESGYILGVDVVSNLLSFVTEYSVLTSLDIALDQIVQKSVQLDSGVIRPCQATTAQATSRHVVVSPILLHHDVSGQF